MSSLCPATHVPISRVLGSLLLVLCFSNAVLSQSSTRNPIVGSDTRAVTVGLRGYCPVCIVEMKQWMKGNPQISTGYDGKTYYFPSQDQLQMFLADPAKYTPALGGDCTVCYANMKQRVPGSVMYSALWRKRLYLFPGKEQQEEFLASPRTYENVDLALGGKCAVCRVEMNQDVPGKPEFSLYYQGHRYLFPSDEQRRMFIATPQKYAAPQPSPGSAMLDDTTSQRSAATIVSVQGKSSCAGCDFGLKPIASPDELGLALKTEGGSVYVVEEAHKLYPQLYEKRFEGMTLSLKGTVVKRDGKHAWIKPAELQVLN